MKSALDIKEVCDLNQICVYAPLDLNQQELKEAMLVPVIDPKKMMELGGSDTEQPDDGSDSDRSRGAIIS